MEIRNNTPSFGMAFKTPSKSEMGMFSLYVTDQLNVSPKLAKRGLAKMVEKHAKDEHFDIYFTAPSSISAEPISQEAQFRSYHNLLEQVPCDKSVIEKYRDKYRSEDYKKAFKEASPGKRFLMNLMKFADIIKVRLTLAFKPEEILPEGMRKASLNVSRWESQISKQVAIEEAKQAKAAQKAQKFEAKRTQAIDEISSVFAPKAKTESQKGKLDAGE